MNEQKEERASILRREREGERWKFTEGGLGQVGSGAKGNRAIRRCTQLLPRSALVLGGGEAEVSSHTEALLRRDWQC